MEEKRDFYVYKLQDLGWPFYVGKGKSLKRCRSHITNALAGKPFDINREKQIAILEALAAGREVEIVIVATNMTETEAFGLERYLIKTIGRYPNGPLTNMTDGGEGQSNIPAESQARKSAKISANQKRLLADPEFCAQTVARLNSPEAVAKRRGSVMVRTFTPEARANLAIHARKNHKGKIWSAESRKKASESARRRGISPATFAKMAASRTGKKRGPHTKETKAKMSAAKMGHPVSAETRAKLRAANLGKRKYGA